MEQIARTLAEAQDFFLQNSSGALKVRGANGIEQVIDSYVDARAFFAANGEAASCPAASHRRTRS